MNVEVRLKAFCVGFFACFSVFADDYSALTTISGFGTFGGGYQSRGDVGFVREINQKGEIGRHGVWRPDTRVGVQVAHAFNPQWQVVGQAVVRDQPDFRPGDLVSRAFVSYRPNPALNLRVGRMADATFLMSDYREVGYAYPWVRPPIESYAIVAPNHYDGADVTYSLRDGEAIWRLKGLVGRIKVDVPQAPQSVAVDPNYPLESNDLAGLALIFEQGPLKLRAGYTQFHLRQQGVSDRVLRPYLQGLAGTVMGNPALKAQYRPIALDALSMLDAMNMQGAKVGYTSLGFAYDDGTWMVQSEISNLSADTVVFPRGQQGYFSIGYRTGDLMPYMTLSGSRAERPVEASVNWGVLGPQYAQLQKQTLSTLNSQRSAQTSLTFGMRWDFHSQAALKVQWDRVHVRDTGWGLWFAPTGYDGKSSTADIVSATIDYVF